MIYWRIIADISIGSYFKRKERRKGEAMIKVKDAEQKAFVPKRTIIVKGARIENGFFVDEAGNIADSVLDALPDGIEEFEIKIMVELPE